MRDAGNKTPHLSSMDGGSAMSARTASKEPTDRGSTGPQQQTARHRVIVTLTDEHIAAVEGWRMAHGMIGQSEALGELVRLGLLSEIAKIFRLVSENRNSASDRGRSGNTRKAQVSDQLDG